MTSWKSHKGVRDIPDLSLIVAVLSSLRTKHKCTVWDHPQPTVYAQTQNETFLLLHSYSIRKWVQSEQSLRNHLLTLVQYWLILFGTLKVIHSHPHRTVKVLNQVMFIPKLLLSGIWTRSYSVFTLSVCVHRAPLPLFKHKHTFIFYRRVWCLSALQAISSWSISCCLTAIRQEASLPQETRLL